MEEAIQVEKLTKSFKKQKVLKGIDLSVKKGTVFALLGPNGAGKTTSVRIMTTLLNLESGKVRVGGFDVVKQANSVRNIIGLTGQNAAVDELLTGVENLEMMGKLYRLSSSDAKSRAKGLLKQFDLEEAATKVVKNYSGGMRRRLDLAISLIAEPPILFLDEPTTGLDPRSRIVMWDVIKDLVSKGTTILLTTQYLEEADELADMIAILDEGNIIAQGTSDQLKQKVGKETLEIEIDKSSDFGGAVKLVGSGKVVIDEKRRTISISLREGVHQVNQILTELEKAKIKVESLSLHKPTLDDVFLKLTGHQATKETEEVKK